MKDFLKFALFAFLMMGIALLIPIPKAFAKSVFQNEEIILSSVAILKNNQVFVLKGYAPRYDVTGRESKEWLEWVAGNQEIKVFDCEIIHSGVFLCKKMMLQGGQDVGRLSVLSGVNEEI